MYSRWKTRQAPECVLKPTIIYWRIKMSRQRKNRPQIYGGDVFIALCVLVLICVIAYQVATYKPYQTGTLTVYDAYMNPKFTFQGEFEYKGKNRWYDNKNQIYYTFENAIFEPSK